MTDNCKRVVVVMDYGDIRGGLEKVAIESALALKVAGKEVHFFCGVAPVDQRLEAAGIGVTCLGVQDIGSDSSRARAARTGIWNAAAALALDKVIRDTQDLGATVVHVHGWTKSLSSAIGPVVTAPDIRHVFTMHEYFFACPNGGFYDYQRNEICTRPALGLGCLTANCDMRHPIHKAYRVVRQVVQNKFGKLQDRVRAAICISNVQLQTLKPYFKADTQFFSVPNPVGILKEPRIQAEKNQNFALLGRMAGTKGVLEFASATRQSGTPALFIGDGELRDAALKVNPSAQITGWLPPEQALEMLNSTRVVVLPSLWKEPFGLVAAEALGKGLPVIAGAWTGAAELIDHGVNGFILDSMDDLPKAFQFFEPHSRTAEISRAAYDRYWADPLTMERHLGLLLPVYEQV